MENITSRRSWPGWDALIGRWAQDRNPDGVLRRFCHSRRDHPRLSTPQGLLCSLNRLSTARLARTADGRLDLDALLALGREEQVERWPLNRALDAMRRPRAGALGPGQPAGEHVLSSVSASRRRSCCTGEPAGRPTCRWCSQTPVISSPRPTGFIDRLTEASRPQPQDLPGRTQPGLAEARARPPVGGRGWGSPVTTSSTGGADGPRPEQAGCRTWFSGLRREQSGSQGQAAQCWPSSAVLQVPAGDRLGNKDVYYYFREFDLPYHPLWEQGYLSVGDMHTTASGEPGMSEEQTRFFGLKRECGLHEEGGEATARHLMAMCPTTGHVLFALAHKKAPGNYCRAGF